MENQDTFFVTMRVCSVCKKEGDEEDIKVCCYIFEGKACDKYVCLDCAFVCIEEDCDMVRCSFEHAEKCRECGRSGEVRCGRCQRQFENDKEAKCIDCINGFFPYKGWEHKDKYEFEWVEEDDNRGHWKITPKSSVRHDFEWVENDEGGYWKFTRRHFEKSLQQEVFPVEKRQPSFWDYIDLSEFDYEVCDD